MPAHPSTPLAPHARKRPGGLLFLLATLHIAATAQAGDTAPSTLPSHGIAPLHKDTPLLWQEDLSKRQYPAETSISALYLYNLGSDARGHKGWGGTFNLTLLPHRLDEHPDWQLKVGVELLGFHSTSLHTRKGKRQKESIDAGAISLLVGGSYFPCQYVEIGFLAGFGFSGTYGETRTPGDIDRNGNANWILQLQPVFSLHITDYASLSLAYRLGYITPIVHTDLIGYHSVNILSQSIEASIKFRF
ncbi:MAG: hypothetical protein LBD01_03800 [Puniceicoccales bacterium]|jgi:hypothetical protein|nr:hypothetical protein [Puniceicoccales bacterium]